MLICPDELGGTLSAVAAAQAIADGWRSAAPADHLVLRPMADGGPGFVEVLAGAVGGTRVPVPTCDPLGRPVIGDVLLTGDVGYVESAHACGLHLLATSERNPRVTTSYGLGALVTAAAEAGVRQIVVGLGGSATNDGGAGLLSALGAVPLDEAGYALPYGGAALIGCSALADAPRLRPVTLVAATDVDNPLLGLFGASSVYGPQKGADRGDVLLLDAALQRFAAVLESSLPTCPAGLGALPGGGAAGGLGAAILALGGRVESGVGLVRGLSRLDQAMDGVDLVITGEGSLDAQSLRGKVVAGVAAAAQERGLPCLVLAGRVLLGRADAAVAGVTEAYSLVEHFGDVERAMADPADGLRSLAARLARQYSR